MKPGAKRSEQVLIYRLMQQNYSAKQIAKQIQVYPETVEKFMKAFEDPKKVPKSAVISKIKDGMPELQSLNNIHAVQAILEEGKVENQQLKQQVTHLAEQLAALQAQVAGPAPPADPAPTDEVKDVFDG